MNAECLKESYKYLKMQNSVLRKLIALFPDDKLNYKPTESIRTVKEIIVHLYGGAKAGVYAIEKGSLSEEENNSIEKSDANTTADLLKFCDECFELIYNKTMQMTDEDLNREIKLFYGDFTIGQILGFLPVEHSHHYGQLTVYARMLGIVPPFAYDFE
ncbi:MAG: DinB family protein [Ignavibacteria bacterium]|nr:DinB family protein [Ignavibacteria bacterium]